MFVEMTSGIQSEKIGSLELAGRARKALNGPSVGFGNSTPVVANNNDLLVAPMDTGLLGSTRVNTPSGPIAIEQLQVGQTVLTSDGNASRVSYILQAERPKSALRIRAPYFGCNQDLIIGQNHYLEIKSDVAEYMFDQQSVFVPAWVFKDNSKVLYHELAKSDVMYQLQVENTSPFGMGNCFVAPMVSCPKRSSNRYLNEAEARAFATERTIGRYN